MLIQWIMLILAGDNLTYIVVNSKESVLPDCDQPYHTNNWIQQKWEEIDDLRNYALYV